MSRMWCYAGVGGKMNIQDVVLLPTLDFPFIHVLCIAKWSINVSLTLLS